MRFGCGGKGVVERGMWGKVGGRERRKEKVGRYFCNGRGDEDRDEGLTEFFCTSLSSNLLRQFYVFRVSYCEVLNAQHPGYGKRDAGVNVGG